MSADQDALRHILDEEDEFSLDFLAAIKPGVLKGIAEKRGGSVSKPKEKEVGKETELLRLIASMPHLDDIPHEPEDTARKIGPWA